LRSLINEIPAEVRKANEMSCSSRSVRHKG
jgi:hypothetical protein